MRKILGAALTGTCLLTLSAAGFLALSFSVLKGLSDLRPLAGLVVFVAQDALTLAVIGLQLTGAIFDALLLVAGTLFMWFGWSLLERTLAASHFEGYALVMGMLAILQGGLTVVFVVGRFVPLRVKPTTQR